MNNLFDMGIIGGADGPTSVFLAGKIGQFNIGAMIAMLLIGLLLCFFGLKLIRFIVGILGLILGGSIGTVAADQLGIEGMTAIIIIFACAIVLAILAFFIYRLGIFLVVFLVIGGIALGVTGVGDRTQVMIALGIAVVIAVVAAVFVEPVIIILTAASGGFLATVGIVNLVGMSDSRLILIGIGAVLTVIGMVIQFVMYSKKAEKKEKHRSINFRKKDSMESEVERARMLLNEEEEPQSDAVKNIKNSTKEDDIEILDDDEL